MMRNTHVIMNDPIVPSRCLSVVVLLLFANVECVGLHVWSMLRDVFCCVLSVVVY